MIEPKEIAEAYQPLFDLLNKEHGLILLQSEMDDIRDACEKVNSNLEELNRIICDVEGCNLTSCNQGNYWRDKGYWCLCSKHSRDGREGKSMPQMKQEAIERENRRNKDGWLMP